MADRRQRRSGHRNPLQRSHEPKHPPPRKRVRADDDHEPVAPPRRPRRATDGLPSGDAPPRRPALPAEGVSAGDLPPHRATPPPAGASGDGQAVPQHEAAPPPRRRLPSAQGKGPSWLSRFPVPRIAMATAVAGVIAVVAAAGLLLRSADMAPASHETPPAREPAGDDRIAASSAQSAASSRPDDVDEAPADSSGSDASIPEEMPPPTPVASDSTRPAPTLPTTQSTRPALTLPTTQSTMPDPPDAAVDVPEAPPTAATEVPPEPDKLAWEQIARSVVQLRSTDCLSSGSGVIIGNGDLVLTNSHVVRSESSGSVCEMTVGFTSSFDEPPGGWLSATLVADDIERDLAVMRLQGAAPAGHPPSKRPPS